MEVFIMNCIKRQLSIFDGVLVCLWMCGRIYLWAQFNPETSAAVQHWTHQTLSDNMWWSSSLHLSVWMCIPVNRIQWKNNQKRWAINPWSDVWQYVVLFFFASQCLDVHTCKQTTMKKQSELLRTCVIKWCFSICGTQIICLSVCGYRYL